MSIYLWPQNTQTGKPMPRFVVATHKINDRIMYEEWLDAYKDKAKIEAIKDIAKKRPKGFKLELTTYEQLYKEVITGP